MTLPLSGNSISLSNIALEFSDSSPYRLSEFYRGGDLVPSAPPTTANIPTSGTIRFSNFYGAAVAGRISLTLEVRSSPTGNYVNSFDVYDLFQSNTTIFPQYANGTTDLTVNVQSGIIVRGNTSPLFGSNYTVRVPAAFITPGNKVTMNVHGLIVGKGGQGGASGGYSAQNGFSGYPGGSALYVAPVPSPGPNKVVNINVFPTGTIAGGGGGGGGGGPRSVLTPRPPKSGGPFTTLYSGGGGGGGVGSAIGLGGPGYVSGNPSANNGTDVWPTTAPFNNTAGAGGIGSPSPVGPAGAGGSGSSNFGQQGLPGSPGVSYSGGPGGAAGNSIVGLQQVNVVTGGPRLIGPQRNS
jgi:hypothetical protein